MLDNIRRTDLDCGCSVTTVRRCDVDSVAIGFFANVGSRSETESENGHSHFLEHMLFKGTQHRRATAISRAVESRGGYMNAETGPDRTCYYVIIPTDGFKCAFDILSDIYTQPLLSEKETERERTVIIEEMNSCNDDPASRADDLFQGNMWPGHPLGRPVIGTLKSLSATTRDTLAAYHAKHYTAKNTGIVAVGNVSHDRIVKSSLKMLSGLSDSTPASYLPFNGESRVERVSSDLREIEQVNAVAGFRMGIGREDERMPALRLLNLILGGNMSSRLFQVVRERHGLAYSVSSSVLSFRETGCLAITAGLDRNRGMKGLSLCGSECRKLMTFNVGPSELNRAKKFLSGSLRIGLESTYSQMKWIGRQLTNSKYCSPAEYLDKLEAVTCDDIRAVAENVFDIRNASLSVVMPKSCENAPEKYFDAFMNGFAG